MDVCRKCEHRRDCKFDRKQAEKIKRKEKKEMRKKGYTLEDITVEEARNMHEELNLCVECEDGKPVELKKDEEKFEKVLDKQEES